MGAEKTHGAAQAVTTTVAVACEPNGQPLAIPLTPLHAFCLTERISVFSSVN